MNPEFAIGFMLALLIKHFIVDFPLQTPYQYLNKGKYGHPGGILHAVLHGGFTFALLLVFFPLTWLIVGLALFDTITHYHIDWLKVKINTANGWTATTSDNFWYLVGIDQLAHQAVYFFIVLTLSRSYS